VKLVNGCLVVFFVLLKLLLFAGDVCLFFNGFTHDFEFVVDDFKVELFAVPCVGFVLLGEFVL